jgi:Arc/MetJ-type ribon-helix-helix transcriptional regulator
MIRTQVQIPEDQYRELKKLAAERDVSISALVREGIAKVIGDDERKEKWKRFLAAAGTFDDPNAARDRVSERHDEILAEIWKDW